MRINAKNLNGFIAMGNAGNFTAGSQLHINTLGIAGGGLGAAAYGNLFRTDGLETILNQWQMFTGLSNATLTEKAKLFTSPATFTQTGQPSFNHFNVQSTQGDIVFRARGYNNIAVFAPREIMRVTRTQYPQAYRFNR